MYKRERIEVVKEYKYLGVYVTSGLSMNVHLNERERMVKNGINVVWNGLIDNGNVCLSAKCRLFAAVFGSAYGYASQVWGFGHLERVDILWRFFLKRVLRLPRSTPDYVVMLETGAPLFSLDVLRGHIRYIIRVIFRYGHGRLARKFAMLELQRMGFWFSEWVRMGRSVSVDMSDLAFTLDEDVWKGRSERLLGELYEAGRLRMLSLAGKSTHGLYGRLNYECGMLYVANEVSIDRIAWVLRARGGMIGLNGCPWRSDRRKLCSMCNRNEIEDVLHFLGMCPVLGDVRRGFFGVKELNEEGCVRVLNGEGAGGWTGLVGYLRQAWSFRRFMVAEFNT